MLPSSDGILMYFVYSRRRCNRPVTDAEGTAGPSRRAIEAAAPTCRAYCLSECTQVCAASITGVPAAPVDRE